MDNKREDMKWLVQKLDQVKLILFIKRNAFLINQGLNNKS
jgi:hypothetical protein